MRTLVIGGSRNLGPGLVAALLARGDEVTVLNRGVSAPVPMLSAASGAGSLAASGGHQPATADTDPLAGVTRVRADRSDRAQLTAALHGRSFDLVIDTFLYTGPQAALIAELLDGRAGRYVWWSTGQVYLVRTGVSRPFRESDYEGPVMPEPPAGTLDHRNWVYGIQKRDAEDIMRTAFAQRGFPAVSLRMPMIASERDHYTRIAGYVRRLFDGGPILIPEDPPLPVRHVYGGDVIAATLRAAGAAGVDGAAPAFNISQDETLEFAEYVYRIGELIERAPRFVRVPRATLEAQGLLPGCSPFSDPWMSSLDNQRSKDELGMRYTPVDEYLPKCVEAALMVPVDAVVGYEKREIELELAEGR